MQHAPKKAPVAHVQMNAGSCLRLLLIRLGRIYRQPFDLKDIVNLGLKKRQGVLENRLELCGAIPGTIFGSQLWQGKSRRRVGARANDRGDILRSRGGPTSANSASVPSGQSACSGAEPGPIEVNPNLCRLVGATKYGENTTHWPTLSCQTSRPIASMMPTPLVPGVNLPVGAL
jgi:hypothetical protein